jgi:antirestriction protein ArdC
MSDTITSTDVYARLTARIIEQLEQGTRPWMKPWQVGAAVNQRPLRANGEPYRGVNVVILWMEATAKGYASPYWLTYKQAQALQAQVWKGKKAATVVYAGAIERTEETEDGEEKERRIPFLKSFGFQC